MIHIRDRNDILRKRFRAPWTVEAPLSGTLFPAFLLYESKQELVLQPGREYLYTFKREPREMFLRYLTTPFVNIVFPSVAVVVVKS